MYVKLRIPARSVEPQELGYSPENAASFTEAV